MPYILFISLTALAGGILNSYGRFAVPAFTPTLLNLSLIGCAVWLAPRLEAPITALAWGVLIAGVAQLALQLPFLARLGLLPRPRLARAHEGVRRILRLMAPALFGSSVVQVNLLINTIIASLLPVGSVTWLYFSDRFVELPLALIGVAIGTVILPRLSQEHASADPRAFAATLDWAQRLALLVAIPATVGLVLLAGPILATVIGYGAFTELDLRMASLSLATYALGLPAFIMVRVLAPAFFARQDTRTPVRAGIAAVGANLLLNALIVLPWVYWGLAGPHAGLALATALAGWVNAGYLLWRLRAQGLLRPRPGWGRWVLRVALALAAMGALLLGFTPPTEDWLAGGVAQRVLWLAALVGGAAGLYLLALQLLGLRPLALLRR
jgi:putative peptidoglycan lipid II flippase